MNYFLIYEQDGRLTRAYWSPNIKTFDQLLHIFKKNENSVLNLTFKGFLQKSFPPLISAILCIINFAGLRSKVQSPKYFSESHSGNSEILGDLDSENPASTLRKSLTIEKKRYKSHFCQFQPIRVRKQGTYFGICLSSSLTHR